MTNQSLLLYSSRAQRDPRLRPETVDAPAGAAGFF